MVEQKQISWLQKDKQPLNNHLISTTNLKLIPNPPLWLQGMMQVHMHWLLNFMQQWKMQLSVPLQELRQFEHLPTPWFWD